MAEETARQIEDELLICRRLADETDFGFLRGSATRLPHRWDLSATLVTRIEPLENAYEYIDGTFRPDVRRLLKLLSGVELYGNELAAVRELLQNAFDAVRERIARERLANRDDPNRAEMLGQLYEVVLVLEQEGDGRLQVRCAQFPKSDWTVAAPGWIREPSTYAEQSLSVLMPKLRSPTGFANLADNLEDLVPGERLSTWQQARDRSQALHDAAHGRLRWSEPVVGNLPNGLGRYRFFFPWFELEGGPCLHFLSLAWLGHPPLLQHKRLDTAA